MDTAVEFRNFPTLELRVERKDGEPAHVVGYSAVFNKLSVDMGWFKPVKERIAPGAFSDVLEDDVRARFNHDSNYVLGRSSSKPATLKLRQDDTGLWMDAIPPDTQWARDLLVSIERGDIREQSFGFILADDGEEWDTEDGIKIRTITKVQQLVDVGPVTDPAYPDTSVALRSFEAWQKSNSPGGRSIAQLERELQLREADRPMG